MEKNMLVEKWEKLIAAPKAKEVPDHLREGMAQLLENQELYINEGSVAGDIAQFTPILIPAVRRIFPSLLAHEIVGVQALNSPTGYAYALRYAYGNTTGKPSTGVTNIDRGKSDAPVFGSVAMMVTGTPDIPTLGVVEYDNAGTMTEIGEAVYAEKGRVLVNLTNGLPAAIAKGATVVINGNPYTIGFVMNNEAGYNLIFKNYSGPYTTAVGEKLGSDMKSMKMSLERVSVEAETRKLKAEYTVELAQDLKNVHGLDAENELINILEYEITAELDRQLIDRINGVATISNPWSYEAGQPGAADGRWEQEKFRTLYTKIVREANMVALTTRRGAANFIVGSINAITALEGLHSFMYSAVPGEIQTGTGIIKVGTIDGRFTVYIDTFSPIDYITVGYKGSSQFDTGVIFCPYVPLMMQKVVDPETFQPKVGFMQRNAIVDNLFGANNYYRTFYVDFTKSTLEGSYF